MATPAPAMHPEVGQALHGLQHDGETLEVVTARREGPHTLDAHPPSLAKTCSSPWRE